MAYDYNHSRQLNIGFRGNATTPYRLLRYAYDGAKLAIELDDSSTSRVYVNEGSSLDSRLVVQYSENGNAWHCPP